MAEALESRTLLDAELAVDLNPATFGSNPGGFVTLGGSTYFFAGGSTLWKTDGTPQGTVAVRDGFRGAQNVAVAGGRIYFAAVTEADQDPAYPDALWTSDGTAAGTVLLRRFQPLYGPVSLDGFVEYRGRVYFRAAAPFEDFRIWSTDNTPAGTTPFSDPAAEPGKAAGWPVVSGDYLYYNYFGGTGQGSSSLWRTDGTAGGTLELREFPSGNNNFWIVNQLTNVNGMLFFTAPTRDGGDDGELWKSDGTPAGTVLVKDVYPGDDFMGPLNLTNVGGMLYFTAADSPTSGNAVWKSDGTEAGTVKVPLPGEPPISATRTTALGNAVIVSGVRPDNTRGLWRTDGTAAGTYLLADVNAGSYSQEGFPRVVVGDELYFAADDSVHGRELWKTDGTPAGTALVRDINPGPGPGGPTGGAALGDKLVFGARGAWSDYAGASDDAEPWVSDGTEAGTFRLKDINTAPQGTPFGTGPFVPVGNSVLFEAGGILHSSDGTPQGTRRLASLYLPQEGPNRGMGWARVGEGRVVFAASDSRSLQPLHLYSSDGTAAGTIRLADLAGLTPMPVVNGFAYFLGYDPALGVELWKTDGTWAGTSLVRELAPGAAGIGPATGAQAGPGRQVLAAVGDTVYFRAFGDQLWRTNGTEPGTTLVKDLDLPAAGQLDWFGAAGGKLLFEASAPGTAPALWASDGTPAGTGQVMPLDVRSPMAQMGGRAFFLGTPAGGSSTFLFVSDGTEPGTVALRDLGPDAGLGHPITPFQGAVYVSRSDGLWKSDGTVAGTVLLAQWPTAPAGTVAGMLAARDDALYFTVNDGTHGRELWKTDGTSAGTVLADDINPGPVGSDPAPLAVVGDGTLFFAATDPVHGRELWKVAAPGPRVYVRGSAWSQAFRNELAAEGLGNAVYGYRIDDKPASDVLPWINLDELVIRFPAPVLEYPSGELPLDGDRGGSDHAPRLPTQIDPRTFAWRLGRPLGAIAAGGENGVRYTLSFRDERLYTFHFNVLQGDVDRSGSVVAADFAAVKRRFFRSTQNPGPDGDTRYSVFHDVDGSGAIVANDFAAVKQRFFDSLLPAAAALAMPRTDEKRVESNLFALPPVF